MGLHDFSFNTLPQKNKDKEKNLESIQPSGMQNSATFKMRVSHLSSENIILILKIDNVLLKNIPEAFIRAKLPFLEV